MRGGHYCLTALCYIVPARQVFQSLSIEAKPLLLSKQLTSIRHSKVSCGRRCENDLPLWLYLQFLHTSVPRPGATAAATTELRSLKFSNSNGATDGATNPG